MKRVTSVVCAVLPLIFSGACRTSADDAESTVENQSEATEVEEPPVKAWIGVFLSNQHEFGDEIREYPTFVKIIETLPSTPARGVLSDGDIFVSVNGQPVTTVDEVIAIISPWPVGDELSLVVRRKKKELTVNLHPEERPMYEEYLQKLYVGKPMPSLQKQVSVAEVQRGGGIVPDSQCVMKGKKACPPYGRSKKTDLAVGKATVVLFPNLWISKYRPVFPLLTAWDMRYGPKGLKIVTVTTTPPSLIAGYLSESDAYPPMTVFAISILERGELKYIEKGNPSVLVLDESGVIRAACLWGKEGLSESCERTVSDLLGVVR